MSERYYLVTYKGSYHYKYIVRTTDKVMAVNLAYEKFIEGLVYTDSIHKSKFTVEKIVLGKDEVMKI